MRNGHVANAALSTTVVSFEMIPTSATMASKTSAHVALRQCGIPNRILAK